MKKKIDIDLVDQIPRNKIVDFHLSIPVIALSIDGLSTLVKI